MDHADRNWERRRGEVGEETLRQVATEQRVMGEPAVVTGMRWETGERMAHLRRRLDGLDVVVQRVHHNLAGRHAGTVPPELLEFQALSVLSANVHQQAVVRNSEDSACLRGGHLLVPNVLKGLC